MANLIRIPFKKDHTSVVGRVKPNGRCKKHPKHQQSPGVCSLCLKEKLTRLSAYSISRRKTTTSFCSSGSSSASSLSSYDSSSSASSSWASPTHRFARSGSSVPIFLMSGKHGIMRSRSMAVVPRRRDREGGVYDHGHRDKSASQSGFWFKLLHPKRKIVKDERDTKLLRSVSIRETVTITG